MIVSVRTNTRLLGDVSLLLTGGETHMELATVDEDIRIIFSCSDSQLEEMAVSFEKNAKAIRVYLRRKYLVAEKQA